MSKKKKILILTVMVLVLGIAAVLNFTLLNKNPGDDLGTSGGNANFFTTYRTIRQEERNEEVLYLDSIIGLEGEEFVSSRQAAVEQKLKLVEVMERELLLEQLLRAKGYEDAIVSVSVINDNINVIIKGEEVTRGDTAIIYSVVKSETGVAPDMVKIMSTT